MDTKTITLQCKDNQTVELSAEFTKFATVLVEIHEDEAIPVPQIDKDTLLFIKKFLESHEYKVEKMVVQKPLVNEKFQDNVDEKTYEQFKNLQTVDNVEKLKPIIDAAYFFGFKELKDACLACLACEFYIGPSEADLEQFKTKHGLQNLQPEQELEIMKEFEPVFQKLNDKFKQEMESEQKKFEESQQLAEEQKQ